MTELVPHLYRLSLGRFQAYLWRDDDSVTLIDTASAAASFRRLADLDADVACFAHGEPVLGNAATRLAKTAAGLPAT